MISRDILVLVNYIIWDERKWNAKSFSEHLGIHRNSLYDSLAVLHHAKLIGKNSMKPNFENIEEFLVCGLKYLFPPKFGDGGVGMYTAYSAEPLSEIIVHQKKIVWLEDDANDKGQISLEPIHKSVPKLCLRNHELHEYFSLLDAIRAGRARERVIGVELLVKKLHKRKSRYE